MKIEKLQDYIELLINNRGENYLFRGEGRVYTTLNARVYRGEQGRYYDYPKLEKAYYQEIASDLSDFERQHFMSYAHQQGLPTPLINLTDNPLEALYYACTQDEQSSEGQVYLFNQAYCLPSDLLDKKDLNTDTSYKTISNDTFVNLLVYFGEESVSGAKQLLVKDLLLNALKVIIDETQEEMLVKNLTELSGKRGMKETGHPVLTKIGNCLKEDDIKQNHEAIDLNQVIVKLETDSFLFNRIRNFEEGLSCSVVVDDFFKYIEPADDSERLYSYSLWWLFLLDNYMSKFNRKKKVRTGEFIPFNMRLPFIVSQSPNFSSSQNKKNALFMLQFSKQKDDNLLRHSGVRKVQILNKKKILEELEAIGVNQQAIEWSHQSIASFVAQKNIKDN